jgi:hypothetical protein
MALRNTNMLDKAVITWDKQRRHAQEPFIPAWGIWLFPEAGILKYMSHPFDAFRVALWRKKFKPIFCTL